MKKRIITAAVFAACLALCAAVWPQSEPVEETPSLLTPPAVTVAQSKVPEVPEIEESIMPEKETVDVAEPEQTKVIAPTPEPPQTPTPPEKEKRQSQSKSQRWPQHHLIAIQIIWSMYQASVGWRIKAPTTVTTPQTCMRTATRLAV